MRRLPRNYLFLSKVIIFCCLFFCRVNAQQVANFVSNGSFEKIIDCNSPFDEFKALGWSGLDSLYYTAPLYNITCGNLPNTNAIGYQMPKEGKGCIRVTFYCPNCSPKFTRANLKNRLKLKLTSGKTYCVKMYVNTQDSCAIAVDGFGFYFGDTTLDTIKYNARLPLTFLSPQVSNPNGNTINDQVNWIPVSGTFVANGNEKYMVIANFKSDVATNTISTGVIISPSPPFSEYFVDAVSCIEVDLPAYAGPDKSIKVGDSAFIGRQPDFAVDSACKWYKFPNMTTPIDTVSGLWVKPSVTTTYIVKQNLDCGNLKWDTVVVFIDLVGLDEQLSFINEQLLLYPLPAQDFLQLKIPNEEWMRDFKTLSIYDHLGREMLLSDCSFKAKIETVNIRELTNGIYFLELKSLNGQKIRKRFVVNR